MKLVAVNGGPRKKWNTARLLDKAVAGAKEAGAETKLVHLYDLEYRGCVSCFACKLKNGPHRGRCAMQDGLTQLLDEIHAADALLVGTPIYLFTETGETRSFLERLVFQYLRYANPPASLFPRRIRTALLYTMNISEEGVSAYGLDKYLAISRGFMERTFGSCETFLSTDTLQFDDYAKYECELFDAAAKRRRREAVFPKDEARAFELGRRLVEQV